MHEVLLNSSRKMDPHVVKLHLEISGLNTTVAEDTPVCEVRVDNNKKEDPHVDGGHRIVRREDSHGADEHHVCAGGDRNCAKVYIEKRAVSST